MLEQDIQRDILRRLRARGAWAVKVITANRNGCPDILVCYQGRFLALEVKRPGLRASPIQVVQIERIGEAGGLAAVVTSWKQVEKLLKKM